MSKDVKKEQKPMRFDRPVINFIECLVGFVIVIFIIWLLMKTASPSSPVDGFDWYSPR